MKDEEKKRQEIDGEKKWDIDDEVPKTKKRGKMTPRRAILSLVIVICVGVFLFSGYKLWSIFREYQKIDAVYGGTADKYTEIFEKHVLPQVKFKELKEVNEDVIGWIFAEDTPINYPVLIGKDNNQYLYRTLYKEYLFSGSIFVDFRCNGEFKDDNTVIYGHKMKNGSMFAVVLKYKEPEFRDKHEYIYILLPDGTYNKYKVVSYYTASIDDPLYDLPINDETKYQAAIDSINANNEYKDAQKITKDDKIITLSTCTVDLDDYKRVVLVAVLEESKELDYKLEG